MPTIFNSVNLLLIAPLDMNTTATQCETDYYPAKTAMNGAISKKSTSPSPSISASA